MQSHPRHTSTLLLINHSSAYCLLALAGRPPSVSIGSLPSSAMLQPRDSNFQVANLAAQPIFVAFALIDFH